jgi:hypothetical protein
MMMAVTPTAIPAIAPLVRPEEACKDGLLLGDTVAVAAEAVEDSFAPVPLAVVVLNEVLDVAVVKAREVVVVVTEDALKALVTEVKTEDADEATTLTEIAPDALVVAIVADKAVGTAARANTPVGWAASTLSAIWTANEGAIFRSGLSNISGLSPRHRPSSVEQRSQLPLQHHFVLPLPHSSGGFPATPVSFSHDDGVDQHSLYKH